MGLTWFIKTTGPVTYFRHGGATHGQNGHLLFVPGQDFGFAILANSDSGETLGMEMFRAALELYFGAVEPEPQLFTRPESELVEYAGIYDAQAQSIELSPAGGGLHVHLHYKGGFPTPETSAQPDPEPFESAFYAPDRIIMTGGPEKGTRAEFLRSPSGQLEWLRGSGRIYRKLS